MKTIKSDFSEPKVVRGLIREYKDIPYMVTGKNTNGEELDISFSEDGMVVRAYQKNGFIRENYYNSNGELEGQTFQGKWN